MLRKFDRIPKDVEKRCVDEVISRVEEIEGSEVGVIAAQDIIDIVKQRIGPEIYNLGVKDAKKLVQERVFDIETGVDLLLQ